MRLYKLDDIISEPFIGRVQIRLLAYERIRARPNQRARVKFGFYLGGGYWISGEDAQRAFAEYNLIGPEEAERRVNAALRQAR